MDAGYTAVKFSEIHQDALLADLYSKLYTIPKPERVKVLMSWLANAYSDLLIPFLPGAEVLNTYTVHVRLLDRFALNSSYEIVAELAAEFGDKFLISQVLPNLMESYEKTADVTYYIQVICENLTCPSLIRKLMDIVTTHLSPMLLGRMSSENSAVASSTLSLIKTLLEFYCEDLWYELILQYLLPMKHLLTSRRQKMLPEIEFHESTNKLLELVPNHVANCVDTSLLAQHFLLYFQDEVTRLRVIDSAVANSLPSSKSQLQKVGLGLDNVNEANDDVGELDTPETKKGGKNQIYPMWVFKYDGTDFLHALRRGYLQEPEEFFEDDLFSAAAQLNSSSTSTEVEQSEKNGNDDSGADDGYSHSHNSNDEENYDFAALSVSAENHTSIHSKTTTESIVKDKRKSIDNPEGSTSTAYFGPFLHAIYDILNNWTILDPDVLFTATELISVLASSRLPLINGLFLDMSLTLQPSYPSFSTLVHSIKNDLDEHMSKYPDYVFRNVWKSSAKECTIPEPPFSSKQGTSEGFVTTLKKTIAQSGSLRMAAEEVQKTIGRRGSLKTFTDLFKTSKTSNRPKEFRLLNRAAAPFESDEEEQVAKAMALRSVLFTHWMLELGAISMQLCWGKRSFLGTVTHQTHYRHQQEITSSIGNSNTGSSLNGNANSTSTTKPHDVS